MDKQSRTYQAYVQILKEELIPAMACAEPIAIVYASARVVYLLDDAVVCKVKLAEGEKQCDCPI
jgi:L-cysteine desulfidase